MSKLSYWLIVPLLAFSVLTGVERESGGKATIQKQEATSVSATIDRTVPLASTDQQPRRTLALKKVVRSLAKPAMKKPVAKQITRREMLVRQAQNARKATKPRSIRPFGARSAPREQRLTVQPKFGGAGFGTDALSTIAAFTNTAGDPINGYTIGDTIILTITVTDTVYMELYVDDGDTLFDQFNDLWFDAEDKGQGYITIIDGDIDDEDPTAGVWQLTLNTGDLGEGGEFFALQGVRLWFNFWTPNGGEGELPLDVLAAPSATSLSGTVTVEGAAAPNIIVVAFAVPEMTGGPEGGGGGEPEIMFISMTDGAGDYTISIDDDQAGQEFMIFAFDLFGEVWGFYPIPRDIPVYIAAGDNLEFLDFDFQPANAFIKGRLTDAKTTTGIGDVHIWVGDGPMELEGTTDASGYYRIPVPGGDYRVEVDDRDLRNQGYMVPYHQDDWVFVFENDSTEVNFETYATDRAIEGQVLWSDGSAAVDINVWGDVPGFYSDTWTDAAGNYSLPVSAYLDTFEVVDPWDSTNTWTNEGYWVGVWEPETVSQPDGRNALSGDTGVDFTLYAADATMTGVVYDHSENPVPHAGLWAYVEGDSAHEELFSTSTQAREDGTYQLKLIGGFEWIVMAFPEEWGPPGAIDTFNVFPGQNIVYDFHLREVREQVVVEGMVFNFDGYGIPNATVEIRQTEGGDYYNSVNTDPEGYFRIEGVPAFSSYEVAAFPLEGEPQVYPVWVDGGDLWLEFWIGGFNRVSVSGMVSGPEGNPLQHAYVFAFDQSSEDPIDVRRTDESGFYDFFVEPGNYEFRAGSPGLMVSSTGFILVDSSLTIDFQLDSVEAFGATGSGQVSAEGGGPIANVFALFISDVYMGQTFTDFSGDYELELVPSPGYTAIYYKEGFLDENHWWVILDGDNPGLNVTLTPVDYLILHTARDVPDDHGKQIFLAWNVHPTLAGNLTRFELWEIGRGAIINPYDPPAGQSARYVGTVPVHPGWTEYSAAVTTLHDGVETWYMVTAVGWDTWEFWDSNPNSGVSTDDKPPEAPQGVTAGGGETADQVVIGWDAANIEPIQYYTIYRSVDGLDFEQLAYSAEPGFVDNLTAQGSYEYTITATDYGDNESAQSAGATYTLLSIVDGMGIPDEFALKANYPNPFNPSTTIGYQLPETGQVSLVIYDLTGNVVSTLVSESQPAGYYQTVWNGRDQRGVPVATGVYFYRLQAGAEFVKTHKMVLMK